MEEEMMFEQMSYSAAVSAAAAAAGSSRLAKPTSLYSVATNGRIYSYDDLSEFPIDGGDLMFPALAVCCDRGNGEFYYLFYGLGDFFFGTIDSAGNVIDYSTNLDEIAEPSPFLSLYREPNGDLIVVDGKDKNVYHNIIRLVMDHSEQTATATLVTNTGELGESTQLRMLFKYGTDIYGVKEDKLEPYAKTIGKYDIELGDFVGGDSPINEMNLYRDGQLCAFEGDPNSWTIISVVQAADSLVYMSAFYYDPIAENSNFGIFKINSGVNGLQDAEWLTFGYVSDAQLMTLFNGYASTYVEE
jgi:hypothetical protein